MSVATASPVIPASVTGPRNRAADAVITGSTFAPALHEQPRQLHRLVRRDAARHAQRDGAPAEGPVRVASAVAHVSISAGPMLPQSIPVAWLGVLLAPLARVPCVSLAKPSRTVQP